MIVIKGATRNRPGEKWIEHALGEEDNYGNPFDLITLRWRRSNDHRTTDYVKTRGFEDTELSERGGQIRVTHIRKGSGCIMWLRSDNMPGAPFTGRLARTPYNLDKLASMYEDNMWTFLDPVVEAEVHALWDRKKKAMSPAALEYHNKRVRAMHTRHNEEPLDASELEKVAQANQVGELRDDRRDINRRRAELNKREGDLKAREKALAEKTGEVVKETGSLTTYAREALLGMQNFGVRKIARQMGLAMAKDASKEDVIAAILHKQGSEAPSAPETVDEILGGAADDGDGELVMDGVQEEGITE